ncbi:basal cell adhesion molecule [Microcaecilia unicolor]|uniref:Basal cell adhesion molecule-like n=1 Tax=Microcaecilia unicolor TaxID=1415580 RepID=A0A6P7YPF2_9AMPH|nr:basal cell adhesion molecule-like [Microcaecilia unicolor]
MLLILFGLLFLPTVLTGRPTIVMQRTANLVLEGSDITLECLSDVDEDMSGYVFQKYSKWMQTWVQLDQPNTFRCWYYDVNVTRDEGRLMLNVKDVHSWHAGPYRCISVNGSSNASASESFTIPIYYLRDILLSQMNSWCGTVGDTVIVKEGSDIEIRCSAQSSQTPSYEWSKEGEDWIKVTDTLKLVKVLKEQSGTYTCQARNPVVFSLVKSKSVHLTVISSEAQTVYGSLSLFSMSTPHLVMAIAVPALALLVVTIIIGIFIKRHRSSQNEKKMALKEAGHRIPIYRGSLESVPSVMGDTQPLVM